MNSTLPPRTLLSDPRPSATKQIQTPAPGSGEVGGRLRDEFLIENFLEASALASLPSKRAALPLNSSSNELKTTEEPVSEVIPARNDLKRR